jgi:hypothetical protein
MSTVSERQIRSHTFFGGRGRFRIPSMPLTAEFQFVTSLYDSVHRTAMLQVVAPYVAEMLHLKLLTINVVTGVAGFLSISHLSHPIPWARIAAGRWRMETPKQCGSEATADQSPSKSE